MFRKTTKKLSDWLTTASSSSTFRLLAPIAFALLLSACSGNHPRDTLNPAGDGAEVSAWFFWLYMVLDTVIFVIVIGAMIMALLKFSKRKGDDDSLPPQSHGNMKLEVIWTVIPTLIILVLSVITIGGVFKLAEKPAEEQKVIEVDVTGKQWWWDFAYRNEKISTANELHVEAGTQVALHLTSSDVIHAFWVPRISGKRDATPGRTYPLYFKPFEEGEFIGQCAELCGASPARMGIKMIVHPAKGPNSYDNWVKNQQTDARAPTTALQKAGKKVFETQGCASCHTIKGVKELAARARNSGPDLTHVGSRTTIAALALKNNEENLAKWVQDPQSIKEAALMVIPKVSDADAKAVAAYLFSLK